ncbi:MAG: aminopeptidase P family N-terminal domain-containing protein, partial [Pseudomonadota bacterium]
MKKSVFRNRLTRLRKRLAETSIDTAWILQPENRRYLSGFQAEDGQLNESSGSLLISRRAAILITDSRYTTEAQKEARDFQVITLKKELEESLPPLLRRLGTKRLGFEEECLSWGLHRRIDRSIKRTSRPVKLMPLKGEVEKMRVVKESSEIDAMEASAHLMSKILEE